ncbi:uncharacterized protein LOC134686513 [Mytilus trossulus]|uniref:uncharacterized protein LOC134686513 n=1 Tax=Mytilus trossulus TaxID=6551 RepID=UPI0030054828
MYCQEYIIILTVITELLAIDDPCPDDIDNKIVADMCTDDHAVEDSVDGSYLIDSVVVRVRKQKANCTCRVSLKDNAGSYSVSIRKWSALIGSAPELPNCGLAINVNHLKAAETKNNSYLIQCSTGAGNRVNNLQKDDVIELKSSIIEGIFTRGYCMQIFRNHQQGGPNVQLNLHCDDPEEANTMNTTHTSATTHYNHRQLSTKEMALTTGTKENAETSTATTKEYNKEKEIASITDTNDNHETSTVTCVTTKGYNKEEDDQNTNMYISIGAGAGGVIVMIAILLIIVCIRKRSKKRTKTEKQIAYDSNDPDSDNGELKDNILYVSADQQDVMEDGNYHMVDLEKKPVVNIGVSNNQTQHISTFDNSNTEYAVVDKGKKSDSVKDDSPLDVQKNSEQDIEMSGLPVDQTYAVVDKTNRGKADE